jgi:hypothetical protein
MIKVSIKNKVVILSWARVRIPLDALVPELITKNNYCFSELLNFFVPKVPSQPAPFLVSQLCKL